jgi:predicted phage terminase large subunit-like protein
MVSRYLAPHFLGEFPCDEVMQVTYKAEFAASFSAFGRNVMRSERYKRLYPNIQLSEDTNKKNEWLIADSNGKNTGGKLFASGLHSGLTGNGFSLGILDDFCSGRAEAESLVQRNNAWEAFTDDFMTRMAPIGIVIILATQWHWDDIIGRIQKAMQDDDNFPKFESLSFPAKARNYKGEGKYTGKYLFLERFTEDWYKSQYATLGQYSAAALLDCNPQIRTGGQLSTDGIVFQDIKEFPDLFRIKYARIWDLAHTKKQRTKDDPDYTSGTVLAFQEVPGDPVLHLWVKHVMRIREGANKRDAKIKQVATIDGTFIRQAIEDSPDAKDAYQYITKALPQISFNKINISGGDKTVRATPLEPIFETPNHVHVAKGDWNLDWLDEIMKFPGGTHDDQVDNLSAGYIFLVKNKMVIDDKTKQELAQRRNRL